VILDLVTELNPYFEKPYIIWQLLLPGYDEQYEIITKEEQVNHTIQWKEIWLKWIENFCNKEKINLIEKEFDLLKLWNEEKYKDPCKSYKIPYYLWFLYYHYLKDPISSAKYYKIASANRDSVEWAKTMSAIMQWKWWEREKSFFMFLNIANIIEPENEICSIFWKDLENIWIWAFINKNLKIDWKLIKTIEDIRIEMFWNIEIKEILEESKCPNYINKAIRELNLEYIYNINKIYFEKNWKNSKNAKQLFDEWYLDFLPKDFQQHEDYWIIYIYNEEIKNYDYEMWVY